MLVIQCDLCRRELQPRERADYGWAARGGVVVLVEGRPARIVTRDGRRVQEVCCDCLPQCVAEVDIRFGTSGNPLVF